MIEYCEPKDVIQREQYYIDLLKPEYNILKVAGSLLGFKHAEETIAAMRQVKLGLKFSELTKAKMRGPRGSITGDKNPMFGKTHTEESKAKIGAYSLGRKHSMDVKTKIRVNSPLSMCVKVTDKQTNETTEYTSMRQTAESLNTSLGTIRNYIRSGKLFRDKYLIAIKHE
jgi:group I intron endonuclease